MGQSAFVKSIATIVIMKNIASPSTQIYHDLHIEQIHIGEQGRQILVGHSPLVIVDIYKWVFGFFYQMFRYHQGGFRSIGFHIHFLFWAQEDRLNVSRQRREQNNFMLKIKAVYQLPVHRL